MNLIASFSEFNIYAAPIDARAAVITKRKIRVTPCPSLTDRDLAAVIWHTGGQDVLLVSYYLDGDYEMKVSTDKLDKVLT